MILIPFFNVISDKDGVDNARRAIYGQKKPAIDISESRGAGTRTVKRQVIKRVIKKKKKMEGDSRIRTESPDEHQA